MLGQEVADILKETAGRKIHTSMNAGTIPSGVYFCGYSGRLDGNEKLVLLK